MVYTEARFRSLVVNDLDLLEPIICEFTLRGNTTGPDARLSMLLSRSGVVDIFPGSSLGVFRNFARKTMAALRQASHICRNGAFHLPGTHFILRSS